MLSQVARMSHGHRPACQPSYHLSTFLLKRSWEGPLELGQGSLAAQSNPLTQVPPLAFLPLFIHLLALRPLWQALCCCITELRDGAVQVTGPRGHRQLSGSDGASGHDGASVGCECAYWPV